MIKLLLISMQVRFSVTANHFIHFLRSIPGLKNAISPGIYGNYSLKTVFIFLGAYFIANKKILIHLLHISFLVTLGAVLNQSEIHSGFYEFVRAENMLEGMTIAGIVRYALLIWFIMGVLGGITSSVPASENHKNDDIIINYLRINAAVYCHGRILFARLVDILLFVPTLLIAFAITGVPLWGVATTLVMYTALRLTGEAVNLIMYKRTGKHFGTQSVAVVTLIVLLSAAVFIPVFIDMPDLPQIFANYITAAIFVPLGIFAWLYVKNYPLYLSLLKDKIRWYNQIMDDAQTKNTFKDAKKWSANITQKDLRSGKHADKTGFAYLNAVFFDRHSKYFRKKIFVRSLFFLALLAAAVIFLIYSLIIGESPAALFSDLQNFFNIAPIFFFIIYATSVGRVVTASVFSNCDIHMLHYPYYRTRETILASFKARFAVILRYNFIITTVMSLSVIAAAWLVFGHMDYLYAGILFALLSVIGVLFAFNDLFLYYIIQPYDSAGKGKSIVYSVINFFMYFVSWINFYVRLEFVKYTVIIIIAVAVYMGVGLALLRLLAPKNFKLR